MRERGVEIQHYKNILDDGRDILNGTAKVFDVVMCFI